MAQVTPPDMELSIARCRVVLSVAALLTLILDAAGLEFPAWVELAPGRFVPSPAALAVVSLHFAYSLTVYYGLTRRLRFRTGLAAISTWNDVLFATVIALVTYGSGGPFLVFFVFALAAAAFRSGLRPTLLVTAVSVALYLSVMVAAAPASANAYILRPVYVVIIGYLFGYLGQRRLNLEAEIGRLVAADQRTQIARELHDGSVQALAAINLRLASCQELLRRGHVAEVVGELGELRTSVNAEHDSLRSYMRSLAGQQPTASRPLPNARTRFSIRANFTGSGAMVAQVLQIVREGVTNVLRHAQAESAAIQIQAVGSQVLITIDDDGVGFDSEAQRPWTIASRVSELGGMLRVEPNAMRGAHLEINLA